MLEKDRCGETLMTLAPGEQGRNPRAVVSASLPLGAGLYDTSASDRDNNDRMSSDFP